MQTFLRIWLIAGCLWGSIFSSQGSQAHDLENTLPEEVVSLIRLPEFSKWKKAGNIILPFSTNHPQGMLKLGPDFYLSTVDTTHNVGFLIRFQVDGIFGKEMARVELLDGPHGERYHPGGIDFDSDLEKIWVPLAEYRANSSAVILTVSPTDLAVEKIVAFPDHLGLIIYDAWNQALHMADWDVGSYTFPLSQFWPTPPTPVQYPRRQYPPRAYGGYEYQDCKHVAQGFALCTGNRGLIWMDGVVDLIRFPAQDPQSNRPYDLVRRIQVPRVTLHQDPAGPLSLEPTLAQNPMDFEFLTDSDGRKFVRLYFVPHDGPNSHLFIYDADPVPLDGASAANPLPTK